MSKDVYFKIELTAPILGMSPSDPEVYTNFVAKRAGQSIESDARDEMDEPSPEPTGYTVFPRDGCGNPCLLDYQIKGFFKDSCNMLSRVSSVDPATGKRTKARAKTLSGKMTSYKKVIDGNFFVSPREIPIRTNHDIAICERPLRAQTAKGERIALAASEQIETGATVEFTVHLLNESDLDVLMEWMAYGEYHGLGQWRNSGKGTFRVVECIVSDHSDALTPKFEVRYA